MLTLKIAHIKKGEVKYFITDGRRSIRNFMKEEDFWKYLDDNEFYLV
jgi:hypothetical protein